MQGSEQAKAPSFVEWFVAEYPEVSDKEHFLLDHICLDASNQTEQVCVFRLNRYFELAIEDDRFWSLDLTAFYRLAICADYWHFNGYIELNLVKYLSDPRADIAQILDAFDQEIAACKQNQIYRCPFDNGIQPMKYVVSETVGRLELSKKRFVGQSDLGLFL
jgi:hypothetical protein